MGSVVLQFQRAVTFELEEVYPNMPIASDICSHFVERIRHATVIVKQSHNRVRDYVRSVIRIPVVHELSPQGDLL